MLLLLAACHTPPDPAAHLNRVFNAEMTDEDITAWERTLDEREPNAGPQHEDLFRTWTADGMSFAIADTVRIREHAAVPEVVRAPDGKVRLLFVEGDFDRARAITRDRARWPQFHGIIGFGAIDQLVSDDGATFDLERAFRIGGLMPGMAVDPCVVPRPEGGWRLYYLGVPIRALVKAGAWDDGSDHTVYSASSTDLVGWGQEGAVVVGPNADPAVWCDGAWCLMVSTGLDRSVSTDGGRSFTFEGSFGVGGFAPAFADLPDGRLRLYYNAKEPGGPLRSMISADRGRSWQAEAGNRVPPYTLEAPSFLPRAEGGWWVYFHYWRDGLSGDSWSNGYMFNPDAPRRGPGGVILPRPPGPGPAPGGR